MASDHSRRLLPYVLFPSAGSENVSGACCPETRPPSCRPCLGPHHSLSPHITFTRARKPWNPVRIGQGPKRDSVGSGRRYAAKEYPSSTPPPSLGTAEERNPATTSHRLPVRGPPVNRYAHHGAVHQIVPRQFAAKGKNHVCNPGTGCGRKTRGISDAHYCFSRSR